VRVIFRVRAILFVCVQVSVKVRFRVQVRVSGYV